MSDSPDDAEREVEDGFGDHDPDDSVDASDEEGDGQSVPD